MGAPSGTKVTSCPCIFCGKVPANTNGSEYPYLITFVPFMAWGLPAALESASSFLVYELWVCPLCPIYQVSSVSYTCLISKNYLEYLWTLQVSPPPKKKQCACPNESIAAIVPAITNRPILASCIGV